MSSSPLLSIFHPAPAARRGPRSFAASVLLHGAAIALVDFGLRHMPRIQDSYPPQRYEMRVLQQDEDDIEAPRMKKAAGGAVARPVARSAVHDAPSAGQAAPRPPVPDLKQILTRTQTLIQPDAPPDLKLLQPVAAPPLVRWTAENTPVKIIVQPPPQPVTSVESKASVRTPNHERVPADVQISSTAFASKAPSLPPSTTSPIVVHRPAPVTHVPETVSHVPREPTPARIVSLPEMQARQSIAPIPMANSIAPAHQSNTLTAGHAEDSTNTGTGKPSPIQKDAAAGQGSGSRQATAPSGNAAATEARQDASLGPGPVAAGLSSAGNDPSVTRISLPKDGHFGVVVVGSSLEEQYPETAEIWNGRLIYTVYLHVGPGKSWILQYSMARAAEPAAAGGNTRPEPPWPFDIARPHLDPGDFNSDAIMVHGIVNPSGRFERLVIVSPAEFQKSKLVLDALEQWQFRPARQNGQIAPVEVLLIIPEETE